MSLGLKIVSRPLPPPRRHIPQPSRGLRQLLHTASAQPSRESYAANDDISTVSVVVVVVVVIFLTAPGPAALNPAFG